jgi:hypothetical protein
MTNPSSPEVVPAGIDPDGVFVARLPAEALGETGAAAFKAASRVLYGHLSRLEADTMVRALRQHMETHPHVVGFKVFFDLSDYNFRGFDIECLEVSPEGDERLEKEVLCTLLADLHDDNPLGRWFLERFSGTRVVGRDLESVVSHVWKITFSEDFAPRNAQAEAADLQQGLPEVIPDLVRPKGVRL